MNAQDRIPSNGPFGALAARLQAAQVVEEAEEVTAKAAAEPSTKAEEPATPDVE